MVLEHWRRGMCLFSFVHDGETRWAGSLKKKKRIYSTRWKRESILHTTMIFFLQNILKYLARVCLCELCEALVHAIDANI